MADLRLSQIWIYPIKSLGGISLQTAKVMPKGLQFDRRWMLVDSNGQFLTQRIHSKMALFKMSLADGKLSINYKEHSISFSTDQTSDIAFDAQIWEDTVSVTEVNSEHNKWFSEHLGINCRLVRFPEKNERRVDPQYAPTEEHVSLADAYPFLIIGQSSLDDLNERLHDPISMKRFRPNFVFTGGEPYDEDSWRNISIGSTQFIGVKRCGRCALPTVDPETGEKGVEPLRTLSIYRKFDNKVYFGQNLIAIDHTEVNVGDRITLKPA
ncbi:MAG TPA: MOSC N-terminal beta barrel domain-containing protein [Chryseolinea sp.]|nr:MOSC N-terminal beta barrel domain-containing protein [Chryseolinea sp.]